MSQRNFYIIAHNPNTIEDVEKNLKAGANSIEPDICYHPDKPEKFYVHEDIDLIPNFIESIFWSSVLSLREYLKKLKDLLVNNPQYDLKLIAFDLKPDYSYDINDLYKIIREDFSDQLPEVTIYTTVSDPAGMNFLSDIRSQRQNELIGVDEHCSPEEVHDFFKEQNLIYGFGAGSSFFSPVKEKFTTRIRRAIDIRDNGGFKFVHVWCVNGEDDMKEYLNMGKDHQSGIDAILTDEPKRLKDLIESDEYNKRFTSRWQNKKIS